jgi:hypothetical protein
MSTAALLARTRRLLRPFARLRFEGECPDPETTHVVTDLHGPPKPEDYQHTSRCSRCGGQHVLEIRHRVVEPGDHPTEAKPEASTAIS